MSYNNASIVGVGEFEGWTFDISDDAFLVGQPWYHGDLTNDYNVCGALDDDSLPKPFPQIVIAKQLLDSSFEEKWPMIQRAIVDQLDLDEFPNENIRIQ